nr:U32 family peptidase [Kofleriaceae bacterium]
MSPALRRPEILSPAGDLPSLRAALAAGADAVYFGLDDGFNARARAANFASSEIAPMVAELHRGGAKAYVTLNTLVFESELPLVAELIARCGRAGVDALIVQDPAVAQLARAICPTMEVHASTQMTVCSPLAAEFMKRLGLARVVVPRELSVDDIREFAAGTSVPLEVFIHGALCVSWSGQCLSSETWGGRSANRGQCAQACRLPYELVVDGETRPLGDVAYLLSPADLVGSMAVAALAEIGVASLKIEGRLKGPAYVATATAHYRAAVAAAVGEALPPAVVDVPTDAGSMYLTYSRGASAGFLGGANHQTLVEGRFGRHRGLPLGRVVSVRGSDVLIETDAAQRPSSGGKAMNVTGASIGAAPNAVEASEIPGAVASPAEHDGFAPPQAAVIPEPGMGAVFDAGRPDEAEQGGPIFAAAPWRSPTGKPGYALRFGQPGPDMT